MIPRASCSVMPVSSTGHTDLARKGCAQPCSTRQLSHRCSHRLALAFGQANFKKPRSRDRRTAIVARAVQASSDQIRLPVNYYSILQVLKAAPDQTIHCTLDALITHRFTSTTRNRSSLLVNSPSR